MLHSGPNDSSGTASPNSPQPHAPLLLRPYDQRLAILAHQGVQGVLPPNSLAALKLAFRDADVVECDIYTIPRDDVPGGTDIVVIHPESFFLFVDSKGMQNEKPLPIGFSELRSVEVRGHQLVPTLDEVLDLYASISGRKAELHIELKGPDTAEAVVPVLQKRITSGELSYDNFLVTGLCYKGDEKSRIEIARELDPQLRLVLVVRGGDLESEGFDGWQGVVEKGRELQVEVITAARKFLTPEIVHQIRDAGFEVGCYHSRTSDELEATLSLGVDLVAADFFRGASIEDYPGVRKHGSPLFGPLQEAGFHQLRDLIWELGWHVEAQREQWVSLSPEQSGEHSRSLPPSMDAALVHGTAGDLVVKLYEEGVLSSRMCDLSRVSLPLEFLGEIDRTVFSESPTFSAFLSTGGQLRLRDSLLDAFMDMEVPGVTPSSMRFLSSLTLPDFLKLGDGASPEHLRTADFVLEPEELAFAETFARDFGCRTGRILGMLAFSALNPRHTERDHYTLSISSEFLTSSSWVFKAAEEQVQAQLLRSGKTGELVVGPSSF